MTVRQGVAWARAGLTAGVLVVAVLASPAAAQATPPSATACTEPDRQFRPASLVIPGVVGKSRILALGRDRHGVPRPPPLTQKGKWELAWDKESRIRPGRRHGVVRLTAHTYPRDGSYGLALGNRLLVKLHTGAQIVVNGPDGQQLCYRVTRRIRVRAEQRVPAYYTSSGSPRLAILVCSGKRRGPGDWSHRTIWFAAPDTSTAG